MCHAACSYLGAGSIRGVQSILTPTLILTWEMAVDVEREESRWTPPDPEKDLGPMPVLIFRAIMHITKHSPFLISLKVAHMTPYS